MYLSGTMFSSQSIWLSFYLFIFNMHNLCSLIISTHAVSHSEFQQWWLLSPEDRWYPQSSQHRFGICTSCHGTRTGDRLNYRTLSSTYSAPPADASLGSWSLQSHRYHLVDSFLIQWQNMSCQSLLLGLGEDLAWSTKFFEILNVNVWVCM